MILGHPLEGQPSHTSAGCVEEGTSYVLSRLPSSLSPFCTDGIPLSSRSFSVGPSVRPLDPFVLALRALVGLPSPSLSHFPPQGVQSNGE